MIPFNKPYLTGKELDYIKDAVESGKISGDGKFTKLCQQFLERRYGLKKVLLTTSCTDALEMSSLLAEIKPGDQVIIPSFTYVSTATAFALRGADIVFCDIEKETLNIDPDQLEKLITKHTKAVVIVHYAGVACQMERITALVKKHNLILIEDAALALDSFYKEKPLGTFGQFATYSFHETKNLISGEGGALAINDTRYIERAEIIREKGTNRTKFWRKEVSKYEWVDIGSSFLPAEIVSAFLYAQLEKIEDIQNKRKLIWNTYQEELAELGKQGKVKLPIIPEYATVNGQIFYLITKSETERDNLIDSLAKKDIKAVFHYLPLHQSPYYQKVNPNIPSLPVSEDISKRLIRLPLFYPMTAEEQEKVISSVWEFYN